MTPPTLSGANIQWLPLRGDPPESRDCACLAPVGGETLPG
jgi:hypothetical protein